MIKKHKVYVKAISSVSAAGNDNETLFESLKTGNTGIAQDTEYFHDGTPAIGKIKSDLTFEQHLIHQCKTILESSDLDNFEETLLIVGSSVGGMATTEKLFFSSNSYKDVDPNFHHIGTIKNIVEKEFAFVDSCAFSTACTSSANAIGYGYEVLSKGIYKNVLVLGADELSQTTVGGFLSLGVLSSNPCKPFDANRDGMNVAEAIACVLLQTTPDEALAQVCGVGYSSDAHHMTQPHPDGLGAKKAMENALELAGIKPNEVDYVNAHGTGTGANDSSEAKAIESLFGNIPYVSSTKSITGHTLGAAGALEAVIATLILQNQIVPTSTSLETIENENINLIQETKEANINYIVSNSFAFGGNNCSLVLGKV